MVAKPFRNLCSRQMPRQYRLLEEFNPWDSCLLRPEPFSPLSPPIEKALRASRSLTCPSLRRSSSMSAFANMESKPSRFPATTPTDCNAKNSRLACSPPTEPPATNIARARASASNSRIIIFGLGGTAQDAMRYSKFYLNAVFHEPLERSTATKLVRSTRSLVLHEFRRYVRVPVMTEVGIVLADGGRMTATSHEISSGGMSLKGTHVCALGSLVEVSFSL